MKTNIVSGKTLTTNVVLLNLAS